MLLLYNGDVSGAVAAQLEVTNCDLKFWSSALVRSRPTRVGLFSVEIGRESDAAALGRGRVH
jgi:hypothetical protein